MRNRLRRTRIVQKLVEELNLEVLKIIRNSAQAATESRQGSNKTKNAGYQHSSFHTLPVACHLRPEKSEIEQKIAPNLTSN